MSEPNTNPSLFGELFRSELQEIVKKAVKEAISQNGHGKEDELLTAKQAGERWNIPPSKIKSMVLKGKLPCVRLGRYVRFSPVDLAEFIQKHNK